MDIPDIKAKHSQNKKHAEIGGDEIGDGRFHLLRHRKKSGLMHQKHDRL